MQSIAEEVRNESDINLNVRLLAFVPMVTSLSGSVGCKSGPLVVSSEVWPHFKHLPSICHSVHLTHRQKLSTQICSIYRREQRFLPPVVTN